MQKITDKKLYRIIDANFNRAKEGLRVCEDVCRFLFNAQSLTGKYKRIRHQLSDAIGSLTIGKLIASRNIESDVGKASIKTEGRREDVLDIFYANSQRVKESIRVLEEFSKLRDVRLSQRIKSIRYKIYAVEKEVITKF